MRQRLLVVLGLMAWLASGALGSARAADEAPMSLDRVLADENERLMLETAPPLDDLGFLRRVTVDLIGRIPSSQEIDEYLALPAAERREQAIDHLLADERFADRWTVFFADMLRLRSQTNGGPALTAYVHKALDEGLPYDTLCRQLLSASGKAGRVPEVGFVLGDQADPMTLAAATAQVFMGIRISCAQCHDHPFDVWKREQFYGLAAYFGKTRRVESYRTRAVYTTEVDQSVVLWPPEGLAPEADRQPMKPAFPFLLDAEDPQPPHVARLVKLRQIAAARLAQSSAPKEATVDDLLDDLGDDAANKAQASLGGKLPEGLDVADEAKQEARKLKVEQDVYRASQLRQELAEMVTSPRNRFFSRNLVNRLWAELLGRGFVEPVDDFSDRNAPSHPQTLDYLADEFVASGFDLRTAIRLIVSSEAYQRGHLVGVDDAARVEAEAAFVAAPVRRMLAETMFDSMVLAGHLSDAKYAAGENMKTVRAIIQVPVKREGIAGKLAGGKKPAMAGMQAMAKPVVQTGYDLESAIEVDFDKLLLEQEEDAPDVEEMTAMSDEELEAQMMEKDRGMKYIERIVETTIDDNPVFTSAMRMASPALPNHFLRVFGQPSRDALGEHRDASPSMRQELMMLNGRLSHEASRVGPLEPIYKLLVGKSADPAAAIKLAYREILTREPSAHELADARQILAEAENPREGMADLRWVLFNCHEFRFLP